MINHPDLKNMKKGDKINLGVCGLIALLLSLSHDTEKWMNGVLAIILKNKKHNDILKAIIKDFISQFQKTHLKTSNFS
jgi:hypothetical protein